MGGVLGLEVVADGLRGLLVALEVLCNGCDFVGGVYQRHGLADIEAIDEVHLCENSFHACRANYHQLSVGGGWALLHQDEERLQDGV